MAGAAHGIAATSRRLAADGFAIGLIDRDTTMLLELHDELVARNRIAGSSSEATMGEATFQKGQRVGSCVYTVEPEEVRQYMALMKFDLPHDGSLVPPDFVPKRCMRDLWGAALLSIGPNIRAKQAFDIYAPIRMGDTVHGTGYLLDHYERRGKEFVLLEGEFVDGDGNLLLRDRRTQMLLPKDFDITSRRGRDGSD